MKSLRRWLGLATLLALWLASAPAPCAELTARFFDVGQGDSALLVSPAGKSVLIDGGPPDAGGTLARRLKQLLGAPLDLVVMTHPHADHLGGLEEAIHAVGARIFMEPGFDHPSPSYERLLKLLEQEKIALKIGEAGRTVDLGGGASMKILSPKKPFLSGTRSDVNSNSIVARVTFGRTAFLFAADAEQVTEEALLASGEELRADLLKVPHHGGRHSSSAEFLKRVGPKVAVVSCGAGNSYGHPTREALDRLEDVRARVLRTDLDGEIVVTSDGERLTVSTQKSAAGATIALAPEPTPRQHAKAQVQAVKARPAPDPAPMPAPPPPPAPEPPAPAAIAPPPPLSPAPAPVVAPAPPAPAPAPQATPSAGPYVGSARSDVFHRPGCRAAGRIKPENLLRWESREQAVGAGRRPAGDCKP